MPRRKGWCNRGGCLTAWNVGGNYGSPMCLDPDHWEDRRAPVAERETEDGIRVIDAARQPTEDVAEALDDLIGLHESIEIIYVVDGYEAALVTHDGATTKRTARGDTVLAALRTLTERP